MVSDTAHAGHRITILCHGWWTIKIFVTAVAVRPAIAPMLLSFLLVAVPQVFHVHNLQKKLRNRSICSATSSVVVMVVVMMLMVMLSR